MGKKWIIIFAMVIFVMSPIYDINAGEDINSAKGSSDDLSQLCKGILNSGDCAAKIEAYQLKKGVVGVSRKGKKLIITLKSGKEITFTDSKEGDFNGKWYNYREYLPTIGYHLVHLQYYEGGGYVFLNANNGIYKVIEDVIPPSISPGLKRIATISWCDAFCNPGIVIMRMTDEDIIKEFSLEPREYWLGGELQWLDDDNIKVTIAVPTYGKIADTKVLTIPGTKIKYVEKIFFLYYADNSWKTKGY
jgi:hypothetical protein